MGSQSHELVQLARNAKIDEELQKEITNSTNQLEAIIERAEAEGAAARFDAVGDGLGPAGRRKS